MNAKSPGDFLLHPDINLGSGVFADANKCQSRRDAFRFQRLDPQRGLRIRPLRDGSTVDEIIGRTQGALSMVSISRTGVLGQRGSMPSSPVTTTRCPLKCLTVT